VNGHMSQINSLNIVKQTNYMKINIFTSTGAINVDML